MRPGGPSARGGGAGEAWEAPEPVSSIPMGDLMASLPPARRIADAEARIRHQLEKTGVKVAVLDDDPTGTQTVGELPVLTSWETSHLSWAMAQKAPAFFILTNSRALSRAAAVELNLEIADGLITTARELHVQLLLASRSDSTLRGHFPAETDALCSRLSAARGRAVDGVVLCPAFLEAGRLTVSDVQWVRAGEELLPAALSEFAADATFGYEYSNLRNWAAAKSGGRLTAADVLSVGISDIRLGGPERVTKLLEQASDGQIIVVNACDQADLEVFVIGLGAAEEAGKTFVYRSGPSFVGVRAASHREGRLAAGDIYRQGRRDGYGLVVVGSHSALTTAQVERLLADRAMAPIEISVPAVVSPESRAGEIRAVCERLNVALRESDVILSTSRKTVTGASPEQSLALSLSVSAALVEVVHGLSKDTPIRFMIAKGGITSSDLATRGLEVTRAVVAGQLFDGLVSVWILDQNSRKPGLPYVIFPGNVGDKDSLLRAVQVLRGT